MMQQFIVVGLIALCSGAGTVWIARRMFECSSNRRDVDIKGTTPVIWRIRDRQIAGMMENINASNERSHDSSESPRGYSTFR